MATVVTTPQHAFGASLISGTAVAASSNTSVSFYVGGFEAQVPILVQQPNTANISAGWEVYAYRSTDGGATYETVASVSFSVARNPNIKESKILRLESGQWALRVVTGGNVAATWSIMVGTQDIITSLINV